MLSLAETSHFAVWRKIRMIDGIWKPEETIKWSQRLSAMRRGDADLRTSLDLLCLYIIILKLVVIFKSLNSTKRSHYSSVLADMTSSSPESMCRIAEASKRPGQGMRDAPQIQCMLMSKSMPLPPKAWGHRCRREQESGWTEGGLSPARPFPPLFGSGVSYR